jgi:osmoprotectant transport system ATP-binding protein
LSLHHDERARLVEPAIKFDDVSKSYGGKPVFHNVTLKIEQNVTTAVVGESGSGKSTLLQLVNGLVVPETGSVAIFGSPIQYDSLSRIRRKMGYAVQGAGLFPHMTVQENITLIAELEKWPVAEILQRYSYLLNLLDLDPEYSDRYPYALSGGQQQRVSLCRAMMLNPPLMLLDEPFSALDPITRDSIHAEFLKLQKAESRTIVLVTHDMNEAIKLADHLVIMKDGEIVQQGSVDEVKANASDDYVERLFSGRVI